MAEIKFSCPHCQQHLSAPAEMGGTRLSCPTCRKELQIPLPLPIQLSPPKKPLAGRLVAGLVGGLILAIMAANICMLVLGDANAKEQSMVVKTASVLVFFGLWAGAVVVAAKAHRAAHAWRRLLISNACLSFALPLAGFFMGGKLASQYAAKGQQVQAAAAGMAGGVMAIILGVLGFFLGAIFLTIGLLVGRKR